MDNYQPLWAEPTITTAGFVATGDRILYDDLYYEVMHRVLSSNGTNTLSLSKDGVTVDKKITIPRSESVAYQKRLE